MALSNGARPAIPPPETIEHFPQHPSANKEVMPLLDSYDASLHISAKRVVELAQDMEDEICLTKPECGSKRTVTACINQPLEGLEEEVRLQLHRTPSDV